MADPLNDRREHAARLVRTIKIADDTTAAEILALELEIAKAEGVSAGIGEARDVIRGTP